MAAIQEIIARRKPAKPLGAKGTLELPRRYWGFIPETLVLGGPFQNRTREQFGICLREEPINHPSVHLPINDFSVPTDARALHSALLRASLEAIRGKTVYAGCMGGSGRTGLFLALMAKVAGVPNPVRYVRNRYHPSAVETKEQMNFIDQYDVTQLQKELFWAVARWRATNISSSIYRTLFRR